LEKEEHEIFMQGLFPHLDKWVAIAGMIKTRSYKQVEKYARRHFKNELTVHVSNHWDKIAADAMVKHKANGGDVVS
jgi:hypothetical protein